ncbi:type I restriction endonuclease [Salinimicrobium sp. HB62]|uniref:type I restriction endonuclease n=1 Tax=Salinimicrobium sp. HB62 TaxID=3077781 RepID=UPI002D76B0E7|nr:type I restriction endonuclease [Salinimicrobium sp. HB62]
MTQMIEITVQKAAIECLQELGYTYKEDNSLQRDLKKVVLEEDLLEFLVSSYPGVPCTAINEALSAFTQHEGMDLDHRNRDFHLKLTQGVSITWKDASGKEQARHLYPINYKEPEKNTFVCVQMK